jgi:alkanesulfonate monooxygenase SsuD/methylene tetrahydromethanopterin reductase-like flavin-dependent oxidoreductase (luciferase family)
MSSRVRFGLSLPNRAVITYGLPVEELLAAADRAEASPLFDSVWVGDNFLSKPRLEAVVLLSALAGRTRRVKLGTVCLATFPLRHPLQFAIQWASLDVVSGGRTILAVCTGAPARWGPHYAAELEANGVADRERVPRLIEGIELLRRFWSDEPVTYDGRFHQFHDVQALPKPVQPRPPIVIASNPTAETEERVLRRIARYADGWQVASDQPVDQFRERWRRIREYADELGRADEVTDASVHIMVNINAERAQARAETREFLDRYYGEGTISDEKLEQWLAHGSPAEVIDYLRRWIDAGCTTPVLRFTSTDQNGQIDRCTGDVLPALQAR